MSKPNKQKEGNLKNANFKFEPAHNTARNVKTNNTLTLLPYIAVFCIPVLLYLQTVSFGFTHFDDDNIILHNTSFLGNVGNFKRVFTTDAFMAKAGLFYRPLQTFSFMIDARFSSINQPWMYHLSSVLLLGLLALLLYRLLKKFHIQTSLALFGTVLFCVHPLFISSVAWLPARGDLLLTVFSLLSFLFLIEYMQTNKIRHLLLHWIVFTLALFCKETAVVLPVLFILYFFCFATHNRFETRYLFILLLYAFSGIGWYCIYAKIVIPLTTIDGITGLKAIVSNIRTIPESVATFFIPTIAPIPQLTVFKTLCGIIFLAVIIVLVFISKTRLLKEKLFYLTWFFLLMLPPMFFKGGLIDYLCHRFMLPLIGILLLLLSMIPEQWLKHTLLKTALLPITLGVILALFTFTQSRAYANPMNYYTEAINKNNHSALAYYNRGTIKINSGDNQGALNDFVVAISLCPTYTEAYYNSGNAKYALGNLQGAVDDFTHALTIDPLYVAAWVNRGNIEAGCGDNAHALSDFTKALTIDTMLVETYSNIGVIKANTGDFEGALSFYAKAIAIRPNYANAYLNRGLAKAGVGKYIEAIADYSQAIALRPSYAEAYNNRGISLCLLGSYKESIADFAIAIEQNPHYVEAYGNRSFARYSVKDYAGAIDDCNVVLQNKPNDQRALTNKMLAQQELQKMKH